MGHEGNDRGAPTARGSPLLPPSPTASSTECILAYSAARERRPAGRTGGPARRVSRLLIQVWAVRGSNSRHSPCKPPPLPPPLTPPPHYLSTPSAALPR